MSSTDPPRGLEMDKELERLRTEIREARLREYIDRFGHLPDLNEKDKRLTDFN